MNDWLKQQEENDRQLKENDPLKYERVMYTRKLMGLLLLPAAPLVFWLDSQPCKFFTDGCSSQGFLSTFLFSLFIAMYLLFVGVVKPLLLRKFGAAEMLRAEEQTKEAVIKFKKEVSSEEAKRIRARNDYLYQLSMILWIPFSGIFFAACFVLNKRFGFCSTAQALWLSTLLGYITSNLVVLKKNEK
jgi:hypothetical protein